jgi:hypothetical protein
LGRVGGLASGFGRVMEEASTVGLELAVVGATHVEDLDGQLAVRPAGPGRLVLAVDRGSGVFLVDRNGPQLVYGRLATIEEDVALSLCAGLMVQRLAALGFVARIVSAQVNRRRIDLLPEPECADPSKTLDELLGAVEDLLVLAGIAGLSEVVEIAAAVATEAGLADPKVTSDAKPVQIGLTDKPDSGQWLMRWLWQRGIAPEQTLVVGDGDGYLAGLPGGDSWMPAGEAPGRR